jgi:DNA polymerase III epsilon subunit-like protein
VNIAFLDIETTGLDPLKNEILEAAAVVRDDGSWLTGETVIHFSLPITPARADDRALEVNKYEERKEALEAAQITHGEAKSRLYDALKGALVVGNNVQFDLRFIEQLLRCAPWYYSPLDLKAYVAGRCGMRKPANTATIADVAGVPIDKHGQHTALADAKWNMRVYDALMGRWPV